MSINLVAQAWGRSRLSEGDEVLVNEMEHHANLVPWQQVTRQTGATLRHIPLTDDGRLDLERLDECLSSRTGWLPSPACPTCWARSIRLIV
ncbi:MAG: hypothetical protein CM1200mP2_50360 [Planctomycetaceae bacterium]|nr:MAG: hypothetical protein CM1200mP2_50360 [Planctomycetaceae bacterium]